jgi:hypothetical protein
MLMMFLLADAVEIEEITVPCRKSSLDYVLAESLHSDIQHTGKGIDSPRPWICFTCAKDGIWTPFKTA